MIINSNLLIIYIWPYASILVIWPLPCMRPDLLLWLFSKKNPHFHMVFLVPAFLLWYSDSSSSGQFPYLRLSSCSSAVMLARTLLPEFRNPFLLLVRFMTSTIFSIPLIFMHSCWEDTFSPWLLDASSFGDLYYLYFILNQQYLFLIVQQGITTFLPNIKS